MVRVATRPAENPVGFVAKKLHLAGVIRDSPKLSLPGKLVFPSVHNSGHFSMLGLGDIVSSISPRALSKLKGLSSLNFLGNARASVVFRFEIRRI